MGIAAAAGIVVDQRGRLLLVRRSRAPGAGQWSIPGGKCRPGEQPRDACVRELREETALDVRVVRWVGRVQRPAPGGRSYIIDDFECVLLDAETVAVAGDDAAEVGWFARSCLDTLPMVDGLLAALTDWNVLPR